MNKYSKLLFYYPPTGSLGTQTAETDAMPERCRTHEAHSAYSVHILNIQINSGRCFLFHFENRIQIMLEWYEMVGCWMLIMAVSIPDFRTFYHRPTRRLTRIKVCLMRSQLPKNLIVIFKSEMFSKLEKLLIICHWIASQPLEKNSKIKINS